MQRRVASSTRAIRRTLERRVDRIEQGSRGPGGVPAQPQGVPGSRWSPTATISTTSTRSTRWKLEEEALEEWLPDTVAELEAEREALGPLLALAQEVEAQRTERKLTELLDVVARTWA